MPILNLKVHRLCKVIPKCYPSSCQLSCRRTSGQMRWEHLDSPTLVSALLNLKTSLEQPELSNIDELNKTPLGRATKTPISHRGSVYHQTVQTVLCGFNLKRLYSLNFIKTVLNNAKTHDVVLKRIKPRFTIKNSIFVHLVCMSEINLKLIC